MSAGTNQRKSLKDHVDYIAARNAEIQAARWDIQEAANAAFEKGLVATESAAEARKVLKQLAKDQGKDAEERAKQRAYEELLDDCRAALGLLADTPLGEAAAQVAAQGASTNGAAPPKKRRRPPGSKNKPKAAVINEIADRAEAALDGIQRTGKANQKQVEYEWTRAPAQQIEESMGNADHDEAPPVPDVPDLPPAA